MEQLRLAAVLMTLVMCTCLLQAAHRGWAKETETPKTPSQEGLSTHEEDAKTEAKPKTRPKGPFKPMAVASKFRRIVEKAAQKQEGKRTERDKEGDGASQTSTSATKLNSNLGMDHTRDKKEDTISGPVSATSGSVALLFIAGAALKKQILGPTRIVNQDSNLPGAMTDGSVIVSESPGLDPSDRGVVFSYAPPNSPRSVLAELAFSFDEGAMPPKLRPQIPADGTSSPHWMAAGVAGLLALFSVAGLFWANKQVKRGGLLSKGLAAWDVENCIMLVDVEAAHRFKRLDGEFLRRSAQVYLDAAQTTGLLRYLEKPAVLSNVVSKLIRRTLTRTELFPVPRDKCFAALYIESTPVKEAVKKTFKDVPAGGTGRDTEIKSEEQVTIKSAFMREVVDPTTGATAGILVHLERCPGWRRARERSYLRMRNTDFLNQLKPSEGFGGCPRIERLRNKKHTIWAETSKSVKNNWMVATAVVDTPLIASITSEFRLQVLACNMGIMPNGALRLYFLVTAAGGYGIKVHYAVGTKQLLINLRGPPAADRTPCATNGESGGGPVFENNLPVYAAFPIKNLRKALNKVSYEEHDQLVTALKDLVLPFKTKAFGVVVEMLQEHPAAIPRKIALRKAREVELKTALEGH